MTEILIALDWFTPEFMLWAFMLGLLLVSFGCLLWARANKGGLAALMDQRWNDHERSK